MASLEGRRLCWKILLIVIITVCHVQAKRKFITTSPSQIRAGFPYHVTVILGDVSLPTDVIVSLKEPITDRSQESAVVVVSQTLRFTSRDSSQVAALVVPTGTSEMYTSLNLTIVFQDGSDMIENGIMVPVTYTNGVLMIQTDKGIYKQSQTVKIRVVELDNDLLPMTDKITIFIKDPKNNRVQMFQNLDPTTGVVQAEFLLSNDPVLGNWTIMAETDARIKLKKDAYFKVEPFELPRFEVKLEAPSSLAIRSSDPVQVKIKASYTYGEPVTGTAYCRVQVLGTVGRNFKTLQSTLNNGEVVCSLTPGDLQLTANGVKGVLVMGNVTESGTGTVITSQVTIPVQKSDVMVSIATSKVYTPDIPLYVCVHITDNEGGVLDSEMKSKLKLNMTIGSKTTSRNVASLDLTQNKTLCELHGDLKESYQITVQATLVDGPTAVYSTSESVMLYKAGMTDTEYPTATASNYSIKVLLWDPANSNPRDTLHGPALVSGNSAVFRVYTSPVTSAFPKLHYQVFSRGGRVAGGDIDLGTESIYFTVTMTAAMTPEATVIVYGVTSSNLVVVDTCKVKVAGALRNAATMSYNTSRAMVKDRVELRVKAEPNSYVLVVAIDKGSLLLAAPNDINNKKVMNHLETLNSLVDSNQDEPMFDFWFGPPTSMTTSQMFKDAGVTVLTDGIISKEDQRFMAVYDDAPQFDEFVNAASIGNEGNDDDGNSNNEGDDAENIRQNFPETWIWIDSVTNSSGDFVHTEILPDSITSWVTRAFVVSPSVGLGIPQNAEVEGFKPFFVTLEVPPRAIRGETFEIKLIVFNYLDGENSVQADVDMLDSDDYVMWKKENDEAVEPYGEDEKFTETLTVPKGGNAVINMWIKPTVVGTIQYQVSARAHNSYSDTVIKTMNILPQGRPIEVSKSILVDNGQVIGDSRVSIIVDKENAVPDSTSILVSRVGDIMGQALTNPEGLLTMPYGCGEQNMITMVPNIFVLKYLKGIGEAGAIITKKATKNIELGYQRELAYQHSDKSFSAFGESDKSGSTWLTAFVVRSFAQTHAVLPDLVDIDVISGAVFWLIAQYDTRSGMFKEPGRVIHREMQGGTIGGDNAGKKLTAYVLISMVEVVREYRDKLPASTLTKINENVNKVTTSLETWYNTASNNNAFLLALYTYALSFVNSPLASNAKSELDQLAFIKTKDDGSVVEKCWLCDMHGNDEPAREANGRMAFYVPKKPSPSAIETTAYAMLGYLATGGRIEARPIMRWLNGQRNGLGGYGSTQDTVMGLFAMSEFAQSDSSDQMNLDVTVTYTLSDDTEMTWPFPPLDSQQEKLVNRQKVLPSNTAAVEISASGTGNAVVTVFYKYNVPSNEESPDINVVVVTWSEDDGRTSYSEACVSSNREGDSGMGLVIFQQATGYNFVDQKNLMKHSDVMRVDSSPEGNLEVYMDKFTSRNQCLRVKQRPTMAVAELQNISVQAMVYYEPDVSRTVFYNLRTQNGPPPCKGLTCGASLPMMQLSVWLGALILLLVGVYIR